MSKYRPRRQPDDHLITMVDTREYSMRTFTSVTSGDYYAPITGSQGCSYCGTRYYLTAGDRMNCTQCGAPL